LEHSQIIFSFNTTSFPQVVGGVELISSDLVVLPCAHIFNPRSTAVIQRLLAFSQPWNRPTDFTQASQTFQLYRTACIFICSQLIARFGGNTTFITLFSKNCHLFLSQPILVPFYYFKINFNVTLTFFILFVPCIVIFLHLLLDLSSCLFRSRPQQKA
jgi:hypothetical protein